MPLTVPLAKAWTAAARAAALLARRNAADAVRHAEKAVRQAQREKTMPTGPMVNKRWVWNNLLNAKRSLRKRNYGRAMSYIDVMHRALRSGRQERTGLTKAWTNKAREASLQARRARRSRMKENVERLAARVGKVKERITRAHETKPLTPAKLKAAHAHLQSLKDKLRAARNTHERSLKAHYGAHPDKFSPSARKKAKDASVAAVRAAAAEKAKKHAARQKADARQMATEAKFIRDAHRADKTPAGRRKAALRQRRANALERRIVAREKRNAPKPEAPPKPPRLVQQAITRAHASAAKWLLQRDRNGDPRPKSIPHAEGQRIALIMHRNAKTTIDAAHWAGVHDYLGRVKRVSTKIPKARVSALAIRANAYKKKGWTPKVVVGQKVGFGGKVTATNKRKTKIKGVRYSLS